MSPAFYLNKQSISSICFTNSTLLVPENLFGFYKLQCTRHGSRQKYFSFIIATYLPQIKILQKKLGKNRVPKWKTQYQSEGQALLKKNFIPLPEDWEALRISASSFGVSMCYLFVLMLEIHKKGHWHKSFEINEEYGNSDIPGIKKVNEFIKFSIFVRMFDFKSRKLIRILKNQRN